MVWVRSEYAGEFAVLSAWLSALIPWSVSFATTEAFTLVVMRFPLFMFQFTLALKTPTTPFMTVLRAVAFETGAVQRAYTVWLVGAAVFALALLLSGVYYALDERLEAVSPIDPVRLMGVLLLGTALVLSVATALLWASFLGGSIPVGVVFLYVLGYVLLVVERTDGVGDAEDDPEGGSAAE